jgi:hypothetical protein
MAAYPHLHLREVSPETELDSMVLRRRAAALDSAALLPAGSELPKVVALRRLAERPAAALESALLQAAWVAQVIVWRPAAVRQMARPSAEFAARARRWAGPVVSAGQGAALPLEEPAAWGAVEAPQPAERDAAEVPQQEVAAWDAAEAAQEVAASDEAVAPRQAVAWAGVAALPPEAVRQQEARDAAVPRRGAVLRAAPDVQVAEPRAARPSVAPWVFRRDQALPWPAPQPPARSVRAMHCLQIALPSALSWQAVGDEVLS